MHGGQEPRFSGGRQNKGTPSGPLLPWFPVLSPGCLSGCALSFRKVGAPAGRVCGSSGVPVPCPYPVIEYLRGGPSGQFPWLSEVVQHYIFQLCSWPWQWGGLRCSTGGLCRPAWLTVSCDFPSAASHYPVRAPSCLWLRNNVQSLATDCKSLRTACVSLGRWPRGSRLPHGSVTPHCLHRLGGSRSLEHNDHPLFLGRSGRGDQVKEGHWLITNPTELQSQVPKSYFVELISETKKKKVARPLPFTGN